MTKTVNFAQHKARQPIVHDGLTATGVDAATALGLTGTWNRITSVPAGTGVRLPTALVGLEVRVIRADYTNSNALVVYAEDGDKVGHYAGGAVTLTAPRLSVVDFCCASDGIWDVIGDIGVEEAPTSAKLVGVASIAVAPILIDHQGRAGVTGRGTITADAVKAA